MNGIELLERQLQRGCKLNPLNKAVISGRMDKENEERIKTMGCVFFPKPFTLPEIVSWLDECEKRIDLSQPLVDVEKRRSPRDPYHTQVDYRCEDDPDSCIAQCVNISEEGICLLLMKEYREGQELTINSELPSASKKASVRWIRKVGDSFYSAGLKFL